MYLSGVNLSIHTQEHMIYCMQLVFFQSRWEGTLYGHIWILWLTFLSVITLIWHSRILLHFIIGNAVAYFILSLITGIRCSMSTIMLEMDRILRPGGRVYIRDTVAVMDELQAIGKAMGWRVSLRDTSEGPHASYRILIGEKRLLRTWRLEEVVIWVQFPLGDPWKWVQVK